MKPLRASELREIRAALTERIREGLAEDGRQIQALPAYLPPPPAGVQGRSTVMDIGGTNMRAAEVQLESGGVRAPIRQLQERLDVRDTDLGRDRFFRMQADLVAKLGGAPDLPLGYCFSYPSEVDANLDARLLKWTKGLEISGVVGTLVGQGLVDALREQGIAPARLCVLNDTVASLMAGAAVAESHAENVIGLIAGTGSNMAAFFSPRVAPKLTTSDAMAINLESGNFHPPHLTEWDDALDAETDQPGQQRFEKAAAGYYLPFLFKRMCPDQPDFDPEAGSAQIVRLRDGGSGPAQQAAEVLLGRSADLIAAGLVAVAIARDVAGPVEVIAEGSLFWGDPKLYPRVKTQMEELLGPTRAVRIFRIQDANLIGSACAALT